MQYDLSSTTRALHDTPDTFTRSKTSGNQPAQFLTKKQQIIVTIICCFLLFVPLVSQAYPATFVVDTLLDNENDGCGVNACTLREAIVDANTLPGFDNIEFTPGLSGTIVLAGSHIVISSAMTINGPGASELAVSGNNLSRVFLVSGTSANAVVGGLTITDGLATLVTIGINLITDGGAILNVNGGTVSILNCHISNSSAGGFGGGIATVSVLPLLATSTTNIYNSSIFGNSATLGGGGVSNLGVDVGLTGLLTGADTTIANSTITSNSALAEGGGLSNTGGHLNLTNTTISHNSSVAAGGGLINVAGIVTGFVFMRNAILAENEALVLGTLISDDGLGIVNSLGNNLIGNNLNISASFAASVFIGGIPQPNINGDLVGSISIGTQIINPDLGSLQDNGGPTHTRALIFSSPAINQGANCVATDTCVPNPNGSNPPFALGNDQRGPGFVRLFNGVVDIGAYEYQIPYTATVVTVKGKVLKADGTPVRNAVVSMTNSFGDVRAVRTNGFGRFSFGQVETGESYLISAYHKAYSFASRLVEIRSDTNDIVLVADGGSGAKSTK
ncbi:MAG: hypothetical protein DWQ47_07175 [Acidobacteria bacterium]|nr:MAG: hypothetical protein DWQ32_15275 [Acidobacteriota bacterium]REJ99293.1 MAG: hypothetical protein DWQ38_14700 [Acidobacteriota bacterium]REK15987.1 MAG: hypothetical protein DWQ43_02985 [Acidobacteriota bacterium]REK43668.1 MAG: hypothetical protein DWQ47_07175 [Acidobacteriota bacterium]